MGLAAGKLTKRLTLQAPVVTQDDYGDTASPDWEAQAEVWAHVEPLSGRELEQARRVVADVTHRVTLRYRPGVLPRWRLLLNGARLLQVESVLNPDEYGEQLVLLCREVV